MKTNAFALLALLLAGCAPIPPDPHHVTQSDAALARHGPDFALGLDAWPSPNWWSAYADPRLDALIAQALRTNPSLDVARSRLAAANAALSARRGQDGAVAALEAGMNRQRYSGNGLFPEPIGGNYFNDSTVQLRAGYNFDWWGKRRAQLGSALGEVKASLAGQAQAEHLLAALVAHSYSRIVGLQLRAANLATEADIETELIADKARRVEHGLARSDELRGAELERAGLEQQMASLETDAAQEHEALRALVGGTLEPIVARGYAAQAHALPSRLGLELLARRPDLQAARYRVEAALGRVAASQAAFYPDINLIGAFGLDAIDIGKLLRGASRTLLAGATLELPLFDSARLGAQLDAARAARDELIADYNQAVLNAVREVAQDGLALAGIERQLQLQQMRLGSRSAQWHSARQRLAQGLAENGAVLQARLALMHEQGARLELLQAERAAEIALNTSLGGGYRAGATSPAIAKP
ncbi:MAG: efflux transporter outer membrane subunit [Pseudomonadota bacterium]